MASRKAQIAKHRKALAALDRIAEPRGDAVCSTCNAPVQSETHRHHCADGETAQGLPLYDVFGDGEYN